jgi:hypothetical protein
MLLPSSAFFPKFVSECVEVHHELKQALGMLCPGFDRLVGMVSTTAGFFVEAGVPV